MIEDDNVSYINWRDYHGEKSSVPVTWKEEYKQFNWRETYLLDSIPAEDVWQTYATFNTIELENFIRRNHIEKLCTKHFMSIRPDLSEGLDKVLEPYKNRQHNYNFLRLDPGFNVMWHYDSYCTFVKFNDIPEEQSKDIKRTAVMLTDWDRGQMLQIGDDTHTKWKAGDTFTWTGDTWHGLGNFGYSEVYVMQITYL